jgi:hypothetical protein
MHEREAVDGRLQEWNFDERIDPQVINGDGMGLFPAFDDYA